MEFLKSVGGRKETRAKKAVEKGEEQKNPPWAQTPPPFRFKFAIPFLERGLNA